MRGKHYLVPNALSLFCSSLVPGSFAPGIRHGTPDRRVAVKRFGYALDPVCVVGCGLYGLNRFWLSRHFGGTFLRGQFNDLLLIPAALPLALWLQRRLKVRRDDRPPRWSEITLHLVAWSAAAEIAAPHLFPRATADWRDVVAYAAGAVVAGCWWQGAPWS